RFNPLASPKEISASSSKHSAYAHPPSYSKKPWPRNQVAPANSVAVFERIELLLWYGTPQWRNLPSFFANKPMGEQLRYFLSLRARGAHAVSHHNCGQSRKCIRDRPIARAS